MKAGLALVASALLAGLTFAYDNGLGPLQWNGWATWSTDDIAGLFDFCNETEVRSVADSLVSSGLKDAGYDLVLLDDCWSATTRDANGNLQPDPTRFPSGIPALVSYIHERGLRLGLYTSAGSEACKNGRLGSEGHFQQDANWFAANNVDMVKADFCHADGSLTPQQIYSNFSAALNATGKAMAFLICEWGKDAPQDWAPAISQVYRATPDHLPFWNYSGPGVQGQGVINVIDLMAVALADPKGFSGPYSWADADFLELGTPFLSQNESRTEFAAWAIMASPLVFAADPRTMTWELDILLNKELIAVQRDPLMKPGQRVLFDSATNTQAWAKQMADGSAALVLINADDKIERNITVTWNSIGWGDQPLQVQVRDLWGHQDLKGNFSLGFTASMVPIHGNSAVRVTKL